MAAGVLMETAQRFVVHARSRTIARIVGYPAGVGILVAAALIDFGATTLPGDPLGWRGIFVFWGLGTLLWTWSVDRRKRIEVTEQTVTVVNTTSRYQVPWSALTDVEIDVVENNAGGTAYHRLVLVTLSRRITAEAPAASRDHMMKLRARILRARDQSLAHAARSVDRITVTGLPALADRLFDGRLNSPMAKRLEIALLVVALIVLSLAQL
jgi:hypothetical protein